MNCEPDPEGELYLKERDEFISAWLKTNKFPAPMLYNPSWWFRWIEERDKRLDDATLQFTTDWWASRGYQIHDIDRRAGSFAVSTHPDLIS